MRSTWQLASLLPTIITTWAMRSWSPPNTPRIICSLTSVCRALQDWKTRFLSEMDNSTIHFHINKHIWKWGNLKRALNPKQSIIHCNRHNWTQCMPIARTALQSRILSSWCLKPPSTTFPTGTTEPSGNHERLRTILPHRIPYFRIMNHFNNRMTTMRLSTTFHHSTRPWTWWCRQDNSFGKFVFTGQLIPELFYGHLNCITTCAVRWQKCHVGTFPLDYVAVNTISEPVFSYHEV